MRRLLPSLAVVASIAALGGVAVAAGASPPRVFTIVPSTPAMTPLATAEVPNADGSLILPPAYLAPRNSAGLPFPALHGIWQQAGATYGIPWQVLAAINKVESNFGRNMGPSSAGAIGWMQFMPSTWQRWGMDANGDGIADPWNPHDAIFAAARYLAAAGGRTDISRGIFAYNHAQWYVDEILGLARLYGQNGVDVPFKFDRAQVRLQASRQELARQNRVLVRATLSERRFARRSQAMYAKADAAPLLSDRLELQKRAFQIDARRAGAAQAVTTAKKRIATTEQAISRGSLDRLDGLVWSGHAHHSHGCAPLRATTSSRSVEAQLSSRSGTTTTTTRRRTSPLPKARPSTRSPTGSSSMPGTCPPGTAASA